MLLKYLKVSFVCFVTLFILSCQNDKSKNTNNNSSLEAIIQFSAGDDYIHQIGDESNAYLPYPFNMGYIRGLKNDQLQCIILSGKLSPRSRLHIKPIAVFKTKERDSEISYIIAVPSESGEKTIKIDHFSDLVTKHSAVKNIIEFWILNRCGLGCAENLSWGNESTASFVLEKFKKS